jgi:hypothetical protein
LLGVSIKDTKKFIEDGQNFQFFSKNRQPQFFDHPSKKCKVEKCEENFSNKNFCSEKVKRENIKVSEIIIFM